MPRPLDHPLVRPPVSGPPARFAAGVAVAVPALILARLSWLHGNDDSYITYSAARSLLQGGGLDGATSPLYAVVLALLERAVPLGIPVWAFALGWAAILWTSREILRLGRVEGWERAALVAAIAWAIWPWTVRYPGMEWPVAIAALVTAISAAARKRAGATAAALALAVVLRPETGLAAALLAAVSTLVGGRRRAAWWLRVGSASLAGWGAWLLTLALATGSALPATVAAKRAQADSPFGFWHGGEVWWRKFLALEVQIVQGVPWSALAGALVLGAGALAFRWLRGTDATDAGAPGETRGLPLGATVIVIWSASLVGAFVASGAPFYPWYAVPIQLGLVVLAAFGAELGRGPGSGPVARNGGRAVAAVLAGGILLVVLPWARAHRAGPLDAREEQYRSVAEFLGGRYPDATRVASLEVGYLGWYGSFRTLDLLGLATPGVPLDAIREGRLDRVVAALDPDLVLLPLEFVDLGRSMVGDPVSFVRTRRLEHVDNEGFPSLFVYRGADAPPRCEVVEDLVAREPERATWAAGRRFGAPALSVAAGSVVALAVQPDGPARAVWALLGSGGAEVRLEASVEDGPPLRQVARRAPAPGSLPVGGDRVSELRWRCRGAEGATCLLAGLHLRRDDGSALRPAR